MNRTVFRELQPLRRNPAVWLIVPFALLFWVLAFMQLVLGLPVGTRPVSNVVTLLLWLGVGVALPALLLLTSLKTEVDAQGVRLAFGLLPRRRVPRAQILRASVRTSDPFAEYGGWGFRLAPGNKRVYLVDGTAGVQLELVGGQQVFIGSRRLQELLSALT
ncbi:DUF6141 family protein [Deinococcus rubellus]|uniref:DUF6141 family protein n=1 Tax=Deinococcus rubellus TaxID=1889240 RepID=A0ABY5YJU8_9DEIO|nr:DUF6141 family protein [Deinococcus rubellus]UWX65083.1 DUF6141 family protein [Deinococcus rubellus]